MQVIGRAFSIFTMLFLFSPAFGAEEIGGFLLFDDASDAIYLYHEKTGDPIDAEDFLNEARRGNNYHIGSVPRFRRMAEHYPRIKDVFEKREYLKKAEAEIDRVKPTFTGKNLALWRYVEVTPFDFDSESFTINVPSARETRVNSWNYFLYWDQVAPLPYKPDTVDKARKIEKLASSVRGGFMRKGRVLPALYIFSFDRTYRENDKPVIKLAMEKIYVYPPGAKVESVANTENRLFVLE